MYAMLQFIKRVAVQKHGTIVKLVMVLVMIALLWVN
jgi:hypothetical protein